MEKKSNKKIKLFKNEAITMHGTLWTLFLKLKVGSHISQCHKCDILWFPSLVLFVVNGEQTPSL